MRPDMLPYLESAFVLLCSTGYTWAIHHFCSRYFACISRRRALYLLLLAAAPPVVTWIRLYSLTVCTGASGLCLSLDDWILLRDTAASPFYSVLPLFRQCLFIFWVLQLYAGSKRQKITAASVLLATVSLLSHFMESLLCCLISVILHTAHIEYTVPLSYALEYPVVIIDAACTIGVIVLLTDRMADFFVDRLPHWYLMVSVPLFSIVILWDCIDLCASRGILLRGGDHLNPYYNELFSYTGMCILSALCMCGVGFYLFGMDRINIEQKQKDQYRSQVLFYQMLETQYSSLEHLRHDMKNHIIGLQRLIDNHEWDKMTDYIHQMADFGSLGHAEDMTGKSIIDALLYYKKSNLQNSFAKCSSWAPDPSGTDSICWECDVHLPSDCPINDFDLCVIFGNLLDNALEACQKMPAGSNRFMKVHAHMVKKCLLIEVANSMVPSGNQKDGIGLRNVRETAKKYNGTLQITTQDNIFRVSILLAPAPCGKCF